MVKTKNRFMLLSNRGKWIIAASVVIVLFIAAAAGIAVTQAAPAQPFPYSHTIHVAQGIACVYCHAGAYRSSSAGLPTLEKCQGCHNNIKAETPLEQQWDEYVKNHTTINWVPVAMMPDFVYFSHQPHIRAAIACTTCHGDVGNMTTAQPQPAMSMGWCLDCHQKMAPEQFAKLSDCATCHK